MARCLPMELAATHGKRISAVGRAGVGAGAGSGGFGDPVSTLAGAVNSWQHQKPVVPANRPTSLTLPGGDIAWDNVSEGDITMTKTTQMCASPGAGSASPTRTVFHIPQRRPETDAAISTARVTGSKRRREVVCGAQQNERIVSRRVHVSTPSKGVASARSRVCVAAERAADVADQVAPVRTSTAASARTLARRPRLRPILKSHSQCKVTGRGSVPVLRTRAAVAVATKRGRAAVTAAPSSPSCTTPGGNTPSPRVRSEQRGDAGVGASAGAGMVAGGAPRGGKVRFSGEAKMHDGPSLINAVFDQLVTLFFSNKLGECHCLLATNAAADETMPHRLVELCGDLAERICASPTGTAAVLPGGGGSVARLGEEHMASLLVLQGMLTEAACAVAMPSTKLPGTVATGALVQMPVAAPVGNVEGDGDDMFDYLGGLALDLGDDSTTCAWLAELDDASYDVVAMSPTAVSAMG